tara:strand:- start:81 stop:227 length:147 start_codon:yes stop_codon:yes gene_type:complete
LSEHSLPLSVETDASNCVFSGSPFSLFVVDEKVLVDRSFTVILLGGVT